MKENIRKWVELLRSTQAPRTIKCLRRGESFSAMGLLCELFRQDHPDTSSWEGDDFNCPSVHGDTIRASASILPLTVVAWADLPSPNPPFPWSMRYSSLRPEDERNTLQGFRDVEHMKDSGVPDAKRVYASAKARRERWEAYKGTMASGTDSLIGLQDVLEFSFEQIASVLTKGVAESGISTRSLDLLQAGLADATAGRITRSNEDFSVFLSCDKDDE